MTKINEVDTSIQEEMQKELEFIRQSYCRWTKGQKSKLLSYLNKEYDLKPATMVSKFKGRNKFNTLEVRAIFEAMKGGLHES